MADPGLGWKALLVKAGTSFSVYLLVYRLSSREFWLLVTLRNYLFSG